eukprot:198398_1
MSRETKLICDSCERNTPVFERKGKIILSFDHNHSKQEERITDCTVVNGRNLCTATIRTIFQEVETESKPKQTKQYRTKVKVHMMHRACINSVCQERINSTNK